MLHLEPVRGTELCESALRLLRAGDGFALHGEDDAKKMELEFPLYDALYAWCKWALGPARA